MYLHTQSLTPHLPFTLPTSDLPPHIFSLHALLLSLPANCFKDVPVTRLPHLWDPPILSQLTYLQHFTLLIFSSYLIPLKTSVTFSVTVSHLSPSQPNSLPLSPWTSKALVFPWSSLCLYPHLGQSHLLFWLYINMQGCECVKLNFSFKSGDQLYFPFQQWLHQPTSPLNQKLGNYAWLLLLLLQ